MPTPQTMPAILARIEHAMQRLVQAITPLSPAQLIEPRLADGRSVKDVLAHLTWWDQWLLFTLPADHAADQPPSRPPLFEHIPPTNDWADAMNARVAAYNRPRALASIQEAFTATCAQLLDRVNHLTTADLYDPEGMAKQIGQPVAPLIEGIYEHYEEHAHEIEQLHGSTG